MSTQPFGQDLGDRFWRDRSWSAAADRDEPGQSAVPADGEGSADQRTFRDVMGRFVTGVGIVTTIADGQCQGMTVNSLTSVSLRPPTVLACLATGTRTCDAVLDTGAFVVNLLAHDQLPMGRWFATTGTDHFDRAGWTPTPDGLPVLTGGVGHLICDVDWSRPASDHHIVVARVRACEYQQGDALVFYRGNYLRCADFDSA